MKSFYKLLFLFLLTPTLLYSFPGTLPIHTIQFENRTDKQYLDSLYQDANNSKYDTVKAINYLKISIALDLDKKKSYKNLSGLDYFKLAGNIAKSKNKEKIFLQAIDDIGVRNRRNGNFKTALRFHMAALSLVDSLHQPKLKSIILNNIGVVYRRIDDFQDALSYHIEALKIADSLDDSKTKAMAINSIGNVYMSLEKYDDALNFFTQSLEIEKKRNNKLGLAINLNNIGSVYESMGKLDSAYYYYMHSMKINKEIGSDKGIAICHSDIGDIYFERKEYRKALHQYNTAEDIFRETNDKIYLANTLLKAGKVLVTINRPTEGEKSLKKALEISLEIGAKVISGKAYKWIAKAYKKQGDYKQALHYFVLSNNLQDSINNIAIQKNIIRTRIQYDLESKETEIALLQQQQQINKLELKKQRAANLLMLVILIFIFFVTMLLAYLIHTRNQKNKLLQEKNKEIEKAQQELKTYSEDLLKAKKEADRSNQAKTEFLANMSHEFRTPLNSVIGFTDLMLSKETNSEKSERLSIIKSSSESLLVLLNDILDLSKIEAGKLEITYQPVDIIKTISEVYKLFKINTDKKGISFTKTIQKNFPKRIIFSEIRLRQILFNVIGNAVKFTNQGKIEIKTEYSDGDEPGKINFCITIHDTGNGISSEDVEKIFKPFMQLSGNGSHQGTGLGLTITKRLIESMGGKLEVKSTLGEGSTFCARFFNIAVFSEDILPDEEVMTSSNKSTNQIKSLLFLTDTDSSCTDYKTILENNVSLLYIIEKNTEKAKPLLNSVDIAILCGSNTELLKQSFINLTNVKQKKPIQFIVISDDVDLRKLMISENYKLVNKAPANFRSLLKEVVNRLLFSEVSFNQCLKALQDNKEFSNEFNTTIAPVFKLAWETRLMNNIKEFSSALMKASGKYNLTSLSEFSINLDKNIHNFNISEVERMLTHFKNHCIAK